MRLEGAMFHLDGWESPTLPRHHLWPYAGRLQLTNSQSVLPHPRVQVGSVRSNLGRSLPRHHLVEKLPDQSFGIFNSCRQRRAERPDRAAPSLCSLLEQVLNPGGGESSFHKGTATCLSSSSPCEGLPLVVNSAKRCTVSLRSRGGARQSISLWRPTIRPLSP